MMPTQDLFSMPLFGDLDAPAERALPVATAADTLATLRQWSDTGWLGQLDSALAAFMADLDPQAAPAVLVAAALVAAFHGLMGDWPLAVSSALRLACASSLGVALTVTTRTGDLVEVLEWLLQPLRPLGVQPERLSLQLALMLRFTEHFFVQWKKLDEAHRLRTGRAGGLRLIAPLTVQMLQTARRVGEALFVRLG